MTDLNQMSTDKPREFCGLFGVFGVPDAAKLIYAGLFSLQHRGQEGAGIVASDGEKIRSTKGMGLINDVFVERPPSTLPGHLGIGHVRYSTTGSSRPQNVQPIVFECLDGIWALAHNGNLTNAARMRRSYQEAGAIFQTSTDSEILMHLLADPMYRSRTRRVERALGELDGAFSFLLMTKDSVMATRDRYGFRPLSIGRLGSGYVFASETCALDQVGATFERDVMPGELVIVDAKGIRSSTFCEPITGQLGQCIFEHVYFARPDSMISGRTFTRRACASAAGWRKSIRSRRTWSSPSPTAETRPRSAFPRKAESPWTTGLSATTTWAARSSCRKWNSAPTART